MYEIRNRAVFYCSVGILNAVFIRSVVILVELTSLSSIYLSYHDCYQESELKNLSL